ncbi:uncharacterized protein Z520_11407 [Fonsecaea multimorphosa CBS 102226]|uniref:Major facilitator superfamily (MFS) profile domain-containing protein n=1 Tax=Fonsecaea multimorphosa CBS 102226 TaxID=1442371 RepID=A0A0D2I6U0_9EURO|nr:uncharacterized protein Z520_11407 [Fonsecaea multimorphosa CBS 102226]KIX92931.1 hypothetical protein Z520_11407 [Fonsecaea multimorphosa CBS 102226]OAL18180.1 hypothetical protein AYO22_10957 [Fonsecaea multimorphosa]
MDKVDIKPEFAVDATTDHSKSGGSTSSKVPDDHDDDASIVVDPVLERRVLRKFDLLVCPQLGLLLLLCQLDRSNIGNAVVFGLVDSLGLVGIEFNNLSMLFYVLYIVFEIPWVMAVKRFGPNKVLAIALVSWSAVTIGTGFIHNYHQAIACRLLLGLTEAGTVPALTFIVSTIYNRQDQAKRIATLYIASAASGAFGGLIAYGIQSMGARHGLEAWRWLFIVEGIISIVLGGICWLSLPSSPERAWFLNQEEREMMAARKRRNLLYKGSDEFSWSWVRMAFKDPFVYGAAAAMFCSTIPLYGLATFLPTIIRGLGYSSLQANYFTIPVYVFVTIVVIIVSYLSDRFQQRSFFAIGAAWACVVGYAIAIGSSKPGVGYFAMFLVVAGVYPFNNMVITWVSNNISPEHKRSVAIPLFFSLANSAGLVASQIYPSRDGPRYVMGNSVSLGVEAFASLIVIAMYLLVRRRNQQKEKLVAQGATENGKLGDQALDFKYAY